MPSGSAPPGTAGTAGTAARGGAPPEGPGNAGGAGSRSRPDALWTIGLVCASMLVYELLLTRVCALRLYFHFGYLVVSTCLLALGASGTFITLRQARWRPQMRRRIFLFAGLYTLSLLLTYALLITFPIPPGLRLNEPASLVRFAVFSLASAVPFFFGGVVVGLILTDNLARVSTVYAVDLAGAAAGCLATPLLLKSFGASGCLLVAALLGLGGVLASGDGGRRRGLRAGGAALILAGLAVLPRVDAWFPVPEKFSLDLTSGVTIALARRAEFSRWSATSRIDLRPVPPHERLLYGLGARPAGPPLPEQKLITQDGWAGTIATNFSQHPEALRLFDRSMYTASLMLKHRPRVLIIGAGGGHDLWAALRRDAQRVKAVELNQQIIDIHREVIPHYSRVLLADPRVELLHDEGRSALMRDGERYDVVQMSGIDTWTALASGAYVLAENYLYTREALVSMLRHLAPGGILHIMRFSAEMEALRMLSNLNAAFEALGLSGFADAVIILHTADRIAAYMTKPGGFSAQEVGRVARFAEEAGIGVHYLPGRPARNLLARFIVSTDKARLIADFPRDISPTTDDRPYFFNYTRWANPFASARYIHETSEVSQGNPLFILGQLLLSALLSAGLILLPLARARWRQADWTHARRFGVYFAGVGLGFISLEVTLMQKLTLFLGHPMYSLTVTLAALLGFTGLGSLLSGRCRGALSHRPWLVPAALAVLVALFWALSPGLVQRFITWPLYGRMALTVGLLAPLGLVLGVPFAYGLRRLEVFNGSLVPWAWAINGCFTVVGSILTVVLSMNLGFSFVLLFAVVAYGVAFLALRGLAPPAGA